MPAAAVVIEEKIRIPARVDSLEVFREWAMTEDFPERGISYIQGEIDIDMSPDELNHNKVKGEVHHVLKGIADGEELGDVFSDGALFTNLAADLSTTPDVLFVSYESLKAGSVEYRKSSLGQDRYVEILGSPDMALEVVSHTSGRKDTQLLRDAYWNAGIEENWLTDVRGPEIHFRILRRAGGDGWKENADEWQLSEVFARRFCLTRSRNPVGHFNYHLEEQATA